jgi:hypothetical protein
MTLIQNVYRQSNKQVQVQCSNSDVHAQLNPTAEQLICVVVRKPKRKPTAEQLICVV